MKRRLTITMIPQTKSIKRSYRLTLWAYSVLFLTMLCCIVVSVVLLLLLEMCNISFTKMLPKFGAMHYGLMRRSLFSQENLLIDADHNLKLIDFGLCAKPKVSFPLHPRWMSDRWLCWKFACCFLLLICFFICYINN